MTVICQQSSGPRRTSCWCRVALDAHAHFYAHFPLQDFLESSWQHARHGAQLGPGDLVVLLMADPGKRDPLQPIWHQRSRLNSPWQLVPSRQPQALVAQREGRPALLLVAGRQVRTCERIELLALATDAVIESGQSLMDTIARSNEAGAVCVVPWGWGKWTGRRGRIVRQVLATYAASGGNTPRRLFLGDTAHRPAAGPARALFRQWCRHAGVVLPGSDPLPLPGYQAAGRFGCCLKMPLAWNQPVESIRWALQHLVEQPASFGRRTVLARAVLDQIRLRIGSSLV